MSIMHNMTFGRLAIQINREARVVPNSAMIEKIFAILPIAPFMNSEVLDFVKAMKNAKIITEIIIIVTGIKQLEII